MAGFTKRSILFNVVESTIVAVILEYMWDVVGLQYILFYFDSLPYIWVTAGGGNLPSQTDITQAGGDAF